MSSAVDALEPRLLRSFVTVAEELHFGRAAARLHISQPPLSAQIKKLETELGVVLLERDRRHVALTEAGRFLLARARHLLAEAERSCVEAGRIARGEAGVLTVGYTSTATYEVLPPLLHAFRKRSPDVQLELVEMRSRLQPDGLRSGRIEVGFACGPLDEQGIDEYVLAKEPFVAALPRRHPLAARKRLRLRDLDGAPFVLVRPDIEPAWADACTRSLVRAGIQVTVVQETDTKIALLGLVAAGLGVSLVSASMKRLGRDGVVFRDIEGWSLRVPLVGLLGPSPSARAMQLMQLARNSA
jgi:DNA-binding transcriptional LysR family regulator